jgi:hypothetical protein
VDQGCERALETVCRIANTNSENDAHRRPVVTVDLARDAAIDDVQNAARREEEYQGMNQLNPIDPIHVPDAISKFNVLAGARS